ncbi:unnamed protein product [Rhizophagus irregularis]|nr:unnamed protein product [Rhizophagus irregularis]
MRIFSAQLFKLYALFLVAIATVALGAPLVRRKGSHGSLICSEQNALTKRADIPFEERCPEEYSLYIASLCSIDAPNLMLINCAREDEPDVIFDTDYTCEDDEICIDRTEFPETPHAFLNLVVAMMTYSTEMNPIQVNYQNVKYKGDLAFVNQVNNFTRVINGYNGENIDFCFNGGTTQKVQAFAAAWITD